MTDSQINLAWRDPRPATPVASFSREAINAVHALSQAQAELRWVRERLERARTTIRRQGREIRMLEERIAIRDAALKQHRHGDRQGGDRLLQQYNSEALVLIAGVAEQHGLTVSDIMLRRRDAATVNARHEAMALVANTMKELSLPAIGRIFDNRDHTTIMHALKKHGITRPRGSPRIPGLRRKQYKNCGPRLLSTDQCIEIRRLSTEGMRTAALSRQFGVSTRTIDRVCRGYQRPDRPAWPAPAEVAHEPSTG